MGAIKRRIEYMEQRLLLPIGLPSDLPVWDEEAGTFWQITATGERVPVTIDIFC